MAAQNNAPLPEGTTLDGYRIVKKISSGGFSIVYLAQDPAGEPVAIKEFLPSTLVVRGSGELEPSVKPEHLPLFRVGLKCFFEEGRALARIQHVNVVRVLNFFRANETVYMVMAYESGRTLQEHIVRQREKNNGYVVDEQFIRNVFRQVMNGLREVHTNMLLHLDIKPANVYLRMDGTPILLDFGAARQTLFEDHHKLYPMYTPGFAAPEMYMSKPLLGPWSDIYSIGATMYSCMAGSPPQPSDARKTQDKMPGRIKALRKHYSRQLVDLVEWSLNMDPLKRPQSVFALQKTLNDIPEDAKGGGITTSIGSLGKRVQDALFKPLFKKDS